MGTEEISIVLNAYDTTRSQRHMTIACIADIVRFTDLRYQLIVVDNEPQWPIRDDYKVFPVYDYIVVNPKETVYASYNRGAKLARADKIFFIQSDVFLHDRTLDKLSIYLDEWDVVFPQQIELSRQDTKAVQATPDGQLTTVGWRDAGLLGITRKAFEKTGGWDERFKNLLGEAAFYAKFDAAGLSWTDRTNTLISHIKAGTNLSKDGSLYGEEMEHDAKLLKEVRGA
jgi:GT2 family glycosyltransferase